ncbi:MAG: hypothetical protein QGH74_06100, partial [Candidatus Brocadiia bacterium]|nr:hypothetical protein [Candidatus Brocadiia bacterium]
VCTLVCASCSKTVKFTRSDLVRNRAAVMRTEAAGFRKDAREKDILIARIEQQALAFERGIKVRTEMLDSAEAAVDEAITRLASAPAEDRLPLESTLEHYKSKSRAVEAAIYGERIRLRECHDTLAGLKRDRDILLREAEASDSKADEYQMIAADLDAG